MKKCLLLIFLLSSLNIAYNQEFKSDKIDPAQWDPNVLLNVKANNGSTEIRITTKGRKAPHTQRKIKHLRINADSYQMIETSGAINIINQKGETVLKTNKDRSEVCLTQDVHYTRRLIKGGRGGVEYLDQDGRLIVSGRLQDGVIELRNHSGRSQEALLSLCLEELMQYAYERYLHAMMMSSFLAET